MLEFWAGWERTCRVRVQAKFPVGPFRVLGVGISGALRSRAAGVRRPVVSLARRQWL